MSYTKTLTDTVNVPVKTWIGSSVSLNKSRTFTFTGTKTGERVDKWRSKVAAGEPAGSPYSLNMTKLVHGEAEQCLGVIQHIVGQDKYAVGLEGFPSVQFLGGNTLHHQSVGTVKARSVALSKLYKKLESDRSQMNAAASIAEIGDVLRQFGRPFQAITNAFLRHHNRLLFERRRLKGRSSWREESFSRIAAETWLETSFGLIPLLSDAVSIAEAFGRLEYELSDSPKLRDRMRSRATETVVTQTAQYGWEQQVEYHGTLRVETVANAQYVVGLHGDIRADFGSNARLKELLGFEARNIPLALWEATPWSWLVDYGTNVQQILQAGATITERVKWIVLTEVTRTTAHSIAVPKLWINPGWRILSERVKQVNPDKRGTKMIRTTLTRTLPTDLGIPPLYFKSPHEDLKKMANLLAVAVTNSKDRRTWLS